MGTILLVRDYTSIVSFQGRRLAFASFRSQRIYEIYVYEMLW